MRSKIIKILLLPLIVIMISFCACGCKKNSSDKNTNSSLATFENATSETVLSDNDSVSTEESPSSQQDTSNKPDNNYSSQQDTSNKPDNNYSSQQTSDSGSTSFNQTVAEHSHAWLEFKSSCTTPSICKICNAKIGSHKFYGGRCLYCSAIDSTYSGTNSSTDQKQSDDNGETSKFGNVLIFGDSYSTFKGHIPSGYANYYPISSNDVCFVDETWWHMLISETGSNLLRNDSWSGSTIGYMGYNNKPAVSSSFIYRLQQLISSGYFSKNKVDTVFVFGGTNDSWANAPLGSLKYENWEEDDLYKVLPAISYFLKTLKDALPDAKIYCLVNTGLKQEIANAMVESCKQYGMTAITFDEIDKQSSHPSIKGMKQIKDKVLAVVNAE